MLFAVSWAPRGDGSEERDKRTLKLFTNWKPPAGFEFKGFYDYADGDGGMAIVEASSAEAMFEVFGTWSTFFVFSARAIVPIEKSVPILEKGIAWRDSVR